jgi:hypothetical protein
MKEKFDMQKARSYAAAYRDGYAKELLISALDRIEELEKALTEERAMNPAKMEWCKHASDDYVCDELDGNCDGWDGCPCKDELLVDAREQLHAEGLL